MSLLFQNITIFSAIIQRRRSQRIGQYSKLAKLQTRAGASELITHLLLVDSELANFASGHITQEIGSVTLRESKQFKWATST